MNVLVYTKGHRNTSSYEEKDTDIIIEHDNYICIYEPDNIGNIVFLATSNRHKKSLPDNVRHFTNELICRGVRIVTIRNKKWKSMLSKLNSIELIYENEEYCIYVRKGLYREGV